MGAAEREFSISTGLGALDPIDVALQQGHEVALDDVDADDGLLSYKGRQVLLYIQDHGRYVNKALEDGSQGNKYHVADCTKLKEMRANERYFRYVATNDFTPEFFVSGVDWRTGAQLEGDAHLKVCKLCLKKLSYHGYGVRGDRAAIFTKFNLEEFFSTYSSFFPHMPTQFAGAAAIDNYTADWAVRAGKYKASRNYQCEQCDVRLSEHKKLLHVHHKSGVKKDNKTSNLKALCAECHRSQPCHGHMFVSHKDRQLITRLRREQSLLGSPDWDQVLSLVDPGVRGVVSHCQQAGKSVPVVGCEIQAETQEVVAELELGWPRVKVGIAIAEQDREAAIAQGWKVWAMVDALDNISDFMAMLR